MLTDPTFWALTAGFGLTLTGLVPIFTSSTLFRDAQAGCFRTIGGVAVIVMATTVKVIS